jgi:hypothetical protein
MEDAIYAIIGHQQQAGISRSKMRAVVGDSLFKIPTLLFTVITSGYLASVMVNKNNMLIFTSCVMPTTSGIAIHLSSVVVKLG